MSKARAWAWFLLGVQIINAVAFALTAMSSFQLSPGMKEQVMTANIAIASVVGGLQAFAKSLSDRDGDGTPDLFDEAPDDPSHVEPVL